MPEENLSKGPTRLLDQQQRTWRRAAAAVADAELREKEREEKERSLVLFLFGRNLWA
jgi:hypothetical protein